jgi:streptomycin 6-kinase
VILPPDFITTIQNTHSRAGRTFLDSLPALLNEATLRWDLSELQTVPNLSYNYVAFAKRGDQDVVLKISVPNNEFTSEMTVLRLFNGRDSVQLLEADEAQGMLLLQRLHPGEMLAVLKDDEQATHIAAGVMLNLWQPAPSNGALIRLSDWFKGFERLRARFAGKTGPLDERLVERAESAVRDFLAEDYPPTLIHGDLHHFNVLSSERGWLAIDPKGVIGPAAYEVGPLLINPWGDMANRRDIFRITKRRISILSERLGFERERIRAWGIAHAVLSAWWSLDDGATWEYAMECARVFSQMDI